MKPRGRVSRSLAGALALGFGLFMAGCQAFVAKHKVLVDSIAAPGTVKPNGSSYRLVAKKSVVSQVQAQVQVVKACIDAALANHAMFEAPPNVAPDIVIEVGYGIDTTARVDPSARETFLQLSARANPEKAIDRATGQELWDVRVAVLGVAGRIETAMPLLASVAATYMATDTKMETKIEIPQNSPSITAVRETAIKSLESKAAAPPAPTPTGATTPPPQPQAPAAPAPQPKTGSGDTGAAGGATASTAPAGAAGAK
jgi:hypothetical protein